MVERRRAGSARKRWGGLAAAAALLLALTGSASAQGLFDLFRAGPSPYDIERGLEDAGYVLRRPLILRGDVYIADVEAGRGLFQRLVIEADSGRIVERFRIARDSDPDFDAADPWGAPPYSRGRFADRGDPDSPMTSPASRGAPPSLYISPEPSDAGKVRAKPKPVDAKRETPAVKTVNPPPAAVAPAPNSAAPTPTPAAAAAPAPTPTPAAAAPPTPAAASPTPSQLAKTDSTVAGPAAQKPAPSAEAPAKKKTVNDLPVTPLD